MLNISKSLKLPHYTDRPPQQSIDTIVIHSMWNDRCGDPFSEEACVSLLDVNKVSSHYLIDRDGKITLLVHEDKLAFHAGSSKMPFAEDLRESVNDFSLGIELIATESSGFTKNQYASLTSLCLDIISRHPIKFIVGHEHIAPERKKDPGVLFDWSSLKQSLFDANPVNVKIRLPV